MFFKGCFYTFFPICLIGFYIQYLTFTYKISHIPIFKHFYKQIPPIVSFLKNGRADALKIEDKNEVFGKIFEVEKKFSLVLSFRKRSEKRENTHFTQKLINMDLWRKIIS